MFGSNRIKNGVKVAADRFDSRMQTLPREDFPTLPDVSGRRARHCRARRVREMVVEDAICDYRRGHPLLPERREVRPPAGEPDARGD